VVALSEPRRHRYASFQFALCLDRLLQLCTSLEPSLSIDLDGFSRALFVVDSQLEGASALPEWLVYYSLLGGAAAWAWASFMSSSEWLSFGLATFIGTGLHLVSTHSKSTWSRMNLGTSRSSHGTMMLTLGLLYLSASAELPVAVVGGATAALVGAGLLSSPFLRPVDALLTLGVLGLAGQQYQAASKHTLHLHF
jgi:hypothetical protein